MKDTTINKLRQNVCSVCKYKLSLSDGFVCGLELNNNNKTKDKQGQANIITTDKSIVMPWNCPYKLEKTIIEGE